MGTVESRSGWGNRRRSATGERWMCKGKKEGACGGVIDERGAGVRVRVQWLREERGWSEVGVQGEGGGSLRRCGGQAW